MSLLSNKEKCCASIPVEAGCPPPPRTSPHQKDTGGEVWGEQRKRMEGMEKDGRGDIVSWTMHRSMMIVVM